MGCMYTALNLGAGEKERGTLETLLLVPAPRSHLVLGKYLVIFTMGMINTVLTITSIALWLSFEGRGAEGVLGEVLASIEVVDLILIALMLTPIAAMFAAILLSISIYGRSVKEAYGASSMFMIAMFVPVVIAVLPGTELTWGWAMVPITNVSLAVRELIKGTMDYTMLLAIFGSSIFIAAGFLLFCSKWFEREEVLFRE
jgi:sodium transport system permease protein